MRPRVEGARRDVTFENEIAELDTFLEVSARHRDGLAPQVVVILDHGGCTAEVIPSDGTNITVGAIDIVVVPNAPVTEDVLEFRWDCSQVEVIRDLDVGIQLDVPYVGSEGRVIGVQVFGCGVEHNVCSGCDECSDCHGASNFLLCAIGGPIGH